MALFNWFRKNKKVTVTKREQNALSDMAAAAFAEAGEHEMAREMLKKPAGKKTILVIGHEDKFSRELIDYSLDMAKRLDFEIMALNVTDAPLSLPAVQREEAIDFFEKNSMKNCTSLQERAERNGLVFNHVVRIGDQDEVVDTLHEQCPNMRYVLTEPDQEVFKKSEGRADIPVFALGSLHNAA